jgi:exonuclease SbcC
LQQEKTEKETERQKKRALMEQTNTSLVTLRKELLQKNKMTERLTLLMTEIGKRKEAYQNLMQRFEKVKHVEFDEKRFNEITVELGNVKTKRDRLLRIEEALKEIDPLSEQIEETKKDISQHEKDILTLEKAVKALHFNEEAYESLTSQIDQTQQKIQQQKDVRASQQTDIKVCENDIKNIDEKLEENKQILASIKGKEKQMILLAKLDEVYKAYKTDKLNKLVPALSSIMSDYIETITDGKYDQIELDDKYNISIYRKGIKNTLDFYSGGEKKLAALCQRLAISQLIVNQTGQANFDMLAMDEVFGAMDNDRQDSIIEMLRNLNETFPQILIVAHNEHVKELFDYVLEIKQDKDGFSTFQWNMDWDEDEVREIAEEFDGNDEETEEEVS